MFWLLFGLVEDDEFNVEDLVFYLMFIFGCIFIIGYVICIVIVVLNMLIVMMNNFFNRVMVS